MLLCHALPLTSEGCCIRPVHAPHLLGRPTPALDCELHDTRSSLRPGISVPCIVRIMAVAWQGVRSLVVHVGMVRLDSGFCWSSAGVEAA